MNSGIYLIKNTVNNKIYIGSSNDLRARFIAHKNGLKKNKHFNKHLQRAYNIYGLESFEFSILAVCPVEYLQKLEQWFITNYKPDYNISIVVGDSPMRGLKFSKEHIAKIQATRKERGQNLIIGQIAKKNIGKSRPPLSQNRIKEIHEQKKAKHNSIKRVEQYSLDNKLIKIFESTVDAALEVGCTYKAIWAACNGKVKTSKGFYWKFQD